LRHMREVADYELQVRQPHERDWSRNWRRVNERLVPRIEARLRARWSCSADDSARDRD
jgi:hypothetical protein